jgi:DNA-binding MarR family transcriptional regulator
LHLGRACLFVKLSAPSEDIIKAKEILAMLQMKKAILTAIIRRCESRIL